jgi:acyl-CoA synthetase (AMP-forming)/AMP-acid ligase II
MVVRFGDHEIAHTELTAQAAGIAGALRAAGVEPGGRVGIVLRNEPTFLALSAACSQAGAVAVPVNWHSSAIREHVGTRLANFKVPRVVVFDDNLPREETGKIFKRRIRQRYWSHAARSI